MRFGARRKLASKKIWLVVWGLWRWHRASERAKQINEVLHEDMKMQKVWYSFYKDWNRLFRVHKILQISCFHKTAKTFSTGMLKLWECYISVSLTSFKENIAQNSPSYFNITGRYLCPIENTFDNWLIGIFLITENIHYRQVSSVFLEYTLSL